jgi:hypothetical protein
MEVLKLGSKGEDVKTLQKELNITVDGDFGPITQNAVIKFQKEYGLIADGIVGPVTWNALLAGGDTDMNKGTHFIEYMMTPGKSIQGSWVPNYYPGPVPKRWLMFHHTAGWDNAKATVDFWSNDNNSIGTEFVVGGLHITGKDNGNDGMTVRCIPKGGYAWHASTGNTPLHRESVGVEICSMGGLTKGGYYKLVNGKNVWVAGKANTYYTAYGNPMSDSEVFDLGWTYRYHRYFHKYSDKQIDECKVISEYCRDEHGVDIKAGLADLIRKNGVEKAFGYVLDYANKVPGIYTHGNVFEGKNDAYPDPRFIDMIMSL